MSATKTKVIKFSAAWCSPCRQVSKILLKLKTEFPDTEFSEVDVDENPLVAKEYKIKSLPTVIFEINDKESGRVQGLGTLEKYKELIQ